MTDETTATASEAQDVKMGVDPDVKETHQDEAGDAAADDGDDGADPEPGADDAVDPDAAGTSNGEETEAKEEDADATAVVGEKRSAPDSRFPVTLGYCTFNDGKAAYGYFKRLIAEFPADTPMNEYEFAAVADLLRKGHPHAQEKIGGGIVRFTVGRNFVDNTASTCLYAHRSDGSREDFSYRKCLVALVGAEPSNEGKLVRSGGRGSFGSRRGGRGGSGRRGGGGRAGGGRGGGRRGRGRN